ncbi:MAG: NnrS family protein, partial [Candidatus Competibacterales bacterium]|nr:NnrS family protein [Candidatus Competibacterales bacterium]
MTVRRPILLEYGFRSFFLLAALAGLGLIAGWLALLHGLRWPGAPLDGSGWHAHEMLFGFGLAAVAGFLLTALAAWTGRAPVRGRTLGGLVAAWLLGRLVLLAGNALPAWLLLPAALAFPLLLAATVTRELLAAGNQRNYPMAGMVALFALFDALTLLAYLGLLPGARPAPILALHLFLLLITLIGGRIIPAFSANWLRTVGARSLPVTHPALERLAPILTVAVGLAAGLSSEPWLLAPLAAAAALTHGLRLVAWRGWTTRRNPLLLILHLGYAWLPIGYILLALAAAERIAPSAAVHAFAAGAMGGMILAVMPRVTLGHTGRPLTADGLTLALFAAVQTAALGRVGAILLPAVYQELLVFSGLCWIAAFALFLG